MSGKRERNSGFWPDFATFCREGEIWITRQIVFDASLPPHCTRVAACIRMSVNFEEGLSKVGVVTIAVALGLSDDTVSRCIAAMEQAGHMSVVWGKGRSKTHHIRWIIKPGTRTDAYSGVINENIVGLDVKNTARLRDFLDAKNTARLRGFGGKNTAPLREKPRKEHDKTPQGCGPNYIENYKENFMGDSPLTPQAEKDAVCEGEKITPAASNIIEADAVALPAIAPMGALGGKRGDAIDGEVIDPRAFEAFWQVYPKKVAKAAAKAAFTKAVTSGADPVAIVRGAEAYAALTKARLDKGEDPAEVYRFTKVPKNWIADERWLDATPPESTATVSQRGVRPVVDKDALAAFAARQCAAAW